MTKDYVETTRKIKRKIWVEANKKWQKICRDLEKKGKDPNDLPDRTYAYLFITETLKFKESRNSQRK